MKGLGYAVSGDQVLNDLMSKVAEAQLKFTMAKLSNDVSVEYDAKVALDKANAELDAYNKATATVTTTTSSIFTTKNMIIAGVGAIGLIGLLIYLKRKK